MYQHVYGTEWERFPTWAIKVKRRRESLHELFRRDSSAYQYTEERVIPQDDKKNELPQQVPTNHRMKRFFLCMICVTVVAKRHTFTSRQNNVTSHHIPRTTYYCKIWHVVYTRDVM